MASHSRDGYFFRAEEGTNDAVKLSQHACDLIWIVGSDIYPDREGISGAAQHQRAHIIAPIDLGQCQ